MTASDDRDLVVAEALASLPVSEHQPGFWDRLERSLAAVDTARDADSGAFKVPSAAWLAPEGPATDYSVVGGGARRRWRRSRSVAPRLVAAVVLVALAAAGAGIAGTGRGGTRDIDVATAPPGSSATESPHDAAAPDTVTTDRAPATNALDGTRESPAPAAEPASAEEAVLAWVDALGAGDQETAIALLGAGSLDYIASLGERPEALMTELAEGYGAWARAADRSTTEVTVLSSGEGTVEVVALTGTVQQEGLTERRAVGLPVRFVGGRYRVEPFDFGEGEARIEFVSPAPGGEGLASLPPDGVIELIAPGADTVALNLNDGDVHMAAVEPDGRVRFDPPGELPSQTHLLVVASIGAEHLTAIAVTFMVVG